VEVQPRGTARPEINRLAFFDTNVLVYADDASSAEKQDRSIALFAEHLRRGTAVMSLQVLQDARRPVGKVYRKNRADHRVIWLLQR
jgi:predicted nucleic acid-binding protein